MVISEHTCMFFCCLNVLMSTCSETNILSLSSTRDLFENVDIRNVVDFIKEIRFMINYNFIALLLSPF